MTMLCLAHHDFLLWSVPWQRQTAAARQVTSGTCSHGHCCGGVTHFVQLPLESVSQHLPPPGQDGGGGGGGGDGFTLNEADAGTPAAVTVSVRPPVGPVVAMLKPTFSWLAVTLETATLEIPVLGLMLTWAVVTPERLRHPVEVTVNVDEVPAVTAVGKTPISGAFGTGATWNGRGAPRIVTVRCPPRAQAASANDKFRLDAVRALTLMLETPSLGSIVTCAAVTPVRSNPPNEAMLSVGELPAGIGGGVMRTPPDTPTGVRLLKVPCSTEPMTRSDVGRPEMSSLQVSVVPAGILVKWVTERI